MKKLHSAAGQSALPLLMTLALSACGGSNSPPILSASSVTLNEDESGFVEISVSDADGDPVSLAISSGPAKGQASLSSSSPYRLTYTPNPDVNGSDSVGVQASDNHGGTATVQVNITIVPVPDPVRLAIQSFTADEDAQFTGRITATDPDGDSVSFSVTTPPAHGVLQITNPATGDFRYTPAPDYNGPDSFIASASDGSSATTALMNLSVRPVNDSPVAADDAVVVAASGTTLLGVLANDRDIDGDPLTITIVGQPPGASATAVGGQISITPASGAAGPTSMSYRITDPAGLSATATVRLVIGSATPVFYTSGDAADALRIYRFDMFTNQLLETPVPTGETLTGFVTSANGRRMIYTSRPTGPPPVHSRLWLKDLADLGAPAREIPISTDFFSNLLISPDGKHAIVGNEHIYLDDLTQRQTFDAGVEHPVFTRNSASLFYSALIGGGSRVIRRITLSGGGVGGPAQMSATPGSAQGLGLTVGLSPDETLITSQGLLIIPPLGLQTHAFVTHADGTQDDRQVSPSYTQPVDSAPGPSVTFDGRYAYYAGTVNGVTAIFAADLSQPGVAQSVANIASGWYTGGTLVAADSRTHFFGTAQLNVLGPTSWYKGRLDQPGSVATYGPAGVASIDRMSMSPDGSSLILRSGTNWYAVRGPGFASGSLLHTATNANGQVSFAPDSRAAALNGADTQPGLRILNPLIPGWSAQLPLGVYGQCVAWAGGRC